MVPCFFPINFLKFSSYSMYMNLQVNSFPIIMIEDFCCVHFISPTHTTSYTEKFWWCLYWLILRIIRITAIKWRKKNRFRCSKVYFNFFQPKLEKSKMSLYIKKAMKSAAEWNSSFQKERREERKAYLDLQTFVIIFSCYFLMLPPPPPPLFCFVFF